ncbi:hypothetical protein A3Q56_02943, partial [Intoshia linei]
MKRNVTKPSNKTEKTQKPTEEILDDQLKSIAPKWKNFIKRFIFGIAMLLGFVMIIMSGPLFIVVLILIIQMALFKEIVKIGHKAYQFYDLPWYRCQSWFFLFWFNFFMLGDTVFKHFAIPLRLTFFRPIITYHKMITFTSFCISIFMFVFNLVKTHYLKQFVWFGWTLITAVLCVIASHCAIMNVLHGIIWFALSTTLIICNDSMAYFCGFFFGRTPLIHISPKKTWEGYIGGAFFTIIYSIIACCLFIKYDYIVCSFTYDTELEIFSQAARSALFKVTEYQLPSTILVLTENVFGFSTIDTYPFMLHAIPLAAFASLFAPFGGFFASGFKRAYKIKDFGAIIPGHGGVTDRFDCQFIMMVFVYVYYTSIVNFVHLDHTIASFMDLPDQDQVKLY